MGRVAQDQRKASQAAAKRTFLLFTRARARLAPLGAEVCVRIADMSAQSNTDMERRDRLPDGRPSEPHVQIPEPSKIQTRVQRMMYATQV